MTNKVQQGVLAGAICHLQPFVYSKCSLLSRLFVCTTYFPSSSPGYMELPPTFPCKSLCLDVCFKCIHLFKESSCLSPKNWTAASLSLPVHAFLLSQTLPHQLLKNLHHILHILHPSILNLVFHHLPSSLLYRPLQLYQQVSIALPRGSCWQSR